MVRLGWVRLGETEPVESIEERLNTYTNIYKRWEAGRETNMLAICIRFYTDTCRITGSLQLFLMFLLCTSITRSFVLNQMDIPPGKPQGENFGTP